MDTSNSNPSPPARLPFHVLAKPFGAFCNLDCAYCFYLPKRGLFGAELAVPSRMSDATLESFTRAYIEAQPRGVSEMEFAWQGGEPTLAGLDFFERALELQRKHARPGLTITNALQTNGTLLDDAWGAFLAEHKFLVGLSLDGPRELHDAYRVDHAGAPSHADVLRGLRVLQRHKVEFNTLTVVHRANQGAAERVYDFLVEAGSSYLQFIPLVEPLSSGGVDARSVEPRAWGEFLVRAFDRWLGRGHVGQVFVRDFDSLLASTLDVPGATCVSSRYCGRCVALERSGDVFACDHFVDWGHHLGRVGEAPLGAQVDSEAQARFGLDKAESLPRQCRECPQLRVCWGGCPKDRIATTRDGESGLNYLCEGYLRFFTHAAPVMAKMARCLKTERPASDWNVIDGPRAAPASADRNAPCPCGSGRKFKRCCGA